MFNEMLSSLNWLAIAAGTAAYWVLGAIWYGPLFSKPWIKMHNIDVNNPDAKKGMAGMFIGSFVLMFVASTGLAILLQLIPAGGTVQAAKLALLVGVCFSFTSQAISYVYLKKPAGLYAIDGLYHVIGLILSGVIMKLITG